VYLILWEFKTVTFAGDTTGAFDTDNAASLEINWFLVLVQILHQELYKHLGVHEQQQT
jgi:hypothetical protein